MDLKFPSVVKIKTFFDQKDGSGLDKVKAMLEILVVDFCNYLNIGKNMNGDQQIPQTCELILKEYYYFSVEEFKLFFENAKKAKFGSIYDRVDGNLIFQWLQVFSDQRDVISDKKAKSQSNQHKKEISAPLLDVACEVNENIYKLLSDIGKSIEDEKILSQQNQTERVQHDPYREFCNAQSNLFDRLVKYKVKKEYVKLGERFFNKTEFINLRFEKKYGN